VKIEPEPDVTLFLHPEMILFPCLNVTFAGTSTLALIVTTVRYVAVVAFPANPKELKFAVITVS
jgi:hypothetical protein